MKKSLISFAIMYACMAAGCSSVSKGENGPPDTATDALKVGGTVQCLAWHPKGALAVLTRPMRQVRSGEGYRLRLWDPKGRKASLEICETPEVMESIAFSPDGARIAGSVWLSKGQSSAEYLAKIGEGVGTEVREWNASTGEQVGALVGKPCTDLGAKAVSELQCIAYSPKGNLVAGGAKVVGTYPIHGSHLGGEVCVWNAGTGQMKWNNRSTHTDMVYAVAFSPDGKVLATGGADKLVRLWNPETGELIKTLYGVGYDGIVSLSFSPDGRLLASGGIGREEAGRIRVWDVRTGELTYTLGNFSREVHPLFIGADVICAAGVVDDSPNATKRSWQVQQIKLGSRKPKRVFPKRVGTPSVIALSSDKTTVAVGTYEGEVYLCSITE
jgi:WD40 repeat protein